MLLLSVEIDKSETKRHNPLYKQQKMYYIQARLNKFVFFKVSISATIKPDPASIKIGVK